MMSPAPLHSFLSLTLLAASNRAAFFVSYFFFMVWFGTNVLTALVIDVFVAAAERKAEVRYPPCARTKPKAAEPPLCAAPSKKRYALALPRQLLKGAVAAIAGGAFAEAVIDLRPAVAERRGQCLARLAPYGTHARSARGREWVGRYRTDLTPLFWQALASGLGAHLSLRRQLRVAVRVQAVATAVDRGREVPVGLVEAVLLVGGAAHDGGDGRREHHTRRRSSLAHGLHHR